MSAGRLRAARTTLTTAPWRRAPLLLRRRPGILATMAGATAVVAASLASVPVFSSSVGSASVQLQIDERCPRDTGVTRRSTLSLTGVRKPTPDPFTSVADRLTASNWWARVERVELAGGQRDVPLEVSVLARGGALDHVEVLASRDGPGIWLSDRATAITGLGVGDFAAIGPTRLMVVGEYRDLSGAVVDDFWCSNGDMLLFDNPELIPPPPLVLADRETLARVMAGLGFSSAEVAWQAGLRPGLTLTEADDLLGDLTCRDGADRTPWCASGRRPLVPASSTRSFRSDRLIEAKDEADFADRFLESSLPFVIERGKAIQTSVGGGVWAIAALATLAGLGLVAAAASLWFDRRQRELALLTVRGVSPAALGLKAVLELLCPVVAGSALGVGAAYGIVAVVGPSPQIEPAALARGAVAGAATLAIALAAVGIVVAARAAPGRARGHRRRWLTFLPWEVLLAGVTVVSFRRLGEWGVPTGRGAAVSRVDLWGLLFPVLFLITGVAIAARVLGLGVRPLRAASRRWPIALHLGVRRVARYRTAALGLLAGAALAAGVLGYSATMNRSLDATLLAKGRTFVGSDVALQLPPGTPLPGSLVARSTEVHAFRSAYIQQDRRVSVTVLAIDPATFERGAYWDDTFAGPSLRDLLDRLRGEVAGEPVPAIVVGGRLPDQVTVSIVGSRTRRFEAAPVEAAAFPGMKPQEATLVVDFAAVESLGAGRGVTEQWIRGDRAEILAAIEGGGTGYKEVRTLGGIADRAAFRTVSWTFGFLQSIGLTAGLLVVGGLAIHLDARRRHRVLGHAFMHRMGLTRRQHRRALLVELTASVVVGTVIGLGIAVAAAAMAHEHIDPVPRYAPAPLLRFALTTISGLVAVTIMVTVVAAVVGQRRVDRDDPLEVLRAGA